MRDLGGQAALLAFDKPRANDYSVSPEDRPGESTIRQPTIDALEDNGPISPFEELDDVRDSLDWIEHLMVLEEKLIDEINLDQSLSSLEWDRLLRAVQIRAESAFRDEDDHDNASARPYRIGQLVFRFSKWVERKSGSSTSVVPLVVNALLWAACGLWIAHVNGNSH
jgi:hypothetical protein